MKKSISILLSIIILTLCMFTISGCGNTDNTVSDETNQTAIKETTQPIQETTQDLREYYGSAEEGDIIKYGKNKEGQDIEWVVIERDAKSADLVSISKIADKAADLYENNYFYDTTLFSWIDDEFIEDYFSVEEKELFNKFDIYNITPLEGKTYVNDIVGKYENYFSEPFWMLVADDDEDLRYEVNSTIALCFPNSNIISTQNTYDEKTVYTMRTGSSGHMKEVTTTDSSFSKDEQAFTVLTLENKLKSKHNVVLQMTISGLKSPS